MKRPKNQLTLTLEDAAPNLEPQETPKTTPEKSGWQIRRLGDALRVQNGFAFDSAKFSLSGGMPLIRIRDLKNGIGTDTRFSGDYDDRYVVRSGDLLIGMDGEFGCYEWKGEPALLNQRVCRLQGFSTDLIPRFLFYGVNSHLKAIEDVTSYATVKHLSSKQILDIEFPFPPLPEQRRIVALLDEAFAAIAAAKANAEKNLQNARELFESHREAVFTERGVGWSEKPLGKVTTIVNGYAFKSTDFSAKKGIKCIKITNVGVGNFVAENDIFLPEDFSLKYKTVAISEGSIVIALTRTIISGGLKVAIVPSEYDSSLLNQRVAALMPINRIAYRDFIFLFLSTQNVINYVIKKVNTLMQPNLSIADLRELPIPLPSFEEQVRVAEYLSILSEQTQQLEAVYQRKLEALEELKKSLLQRAFSGEL